MRPRTEGGYKYQLLLEYNYLRSQSTAIFNMHLCISYVVKLEILIIKVIKFGGRFVIGSMAQDIQRVELSLITGK